MITFTAQAEELISKLGDKEDVKKRLITIAEKRTVIIAGSDVIRFMIKGDLDNNLYAEDIQ